MRICKEENCENIVLCKGVCGKHYYQLNREHLLAKQKRYAERHPDKIRAKRKHHYENNREYYAAKNKRWRQKNPEKDRQRGQQYRAKNKERVLFVKRAWKIKNQEKIRAAQTRRYREDIGFKLRRILSARLTTSLRRRDIKSRRKSITSRATGCTENQFIEHLESKFLLGMSWQNYGKKGWHIDHIIPCAAFDLSKPEQVLKCFHFSNLQPLWASDNQHKSDSLEWKSEI